MENLKITKEQLQSIANFENWFVETDGFTFMQTVSDDRTLDCAFESIGLPGLFSPFAELVANNLAKYVLNDNVLSIRLDNSLCEDLNF